MSWPAQVQSQTVVATLLVLTAAVLPAIALQRLSERDDWATGPRMLTYLDQAGTTLATRPGELRGEHMVEWG
jgi:hypothetical protein